MLARQITLNYRSRTDLTCLSPYSYKLFGAPKKANPHRINSLRALRQKHPGRGYAFAHQSLLATGFSRPLFSPRYELLFPQPPSFHNDPRCPLAWRPPAPRHMVFHAQASDRIRESGRRKETQERANSAELHRHLMLYFAIQCTETPFRERFGATPSTPVDYSL